MSFNMAEVSMQKAFDTLLPGCFETSWVVSMAHKCDSIYRGSGTDKRLHSLSRVCDEAESNICYDLITKLGHSFMDSTGKSKPTSVLMAATTKLKIAGLREIEDAMLEQANAAAQQDPDSARRRRIVLIVGNAMWHFCSRNIRGMSTYDFIETLGECNILPSGVLLKHSSKIDTHSAAVVNFSRVKLRHSTPSLIKPRRRDSEMIGVFNGDWEFESGAAVVIERDMEETPVATGNQY